MRANLNSGFGQIKRTLSRIYVFIPITKKSFCSVILFSCYFSSFRPSKARHLFFFLQIRYCKDWRAQIVMTPQIFFINWKELEFQDVKRDSIGLKLQFWRCNHTCAQIAKNAIEICKTAEKIFKVKKMLP